MKKYNPPIPCICKCSKQDCRWLQLNKVVGLGRACSQSRVVQTRGAADMDLLSSWRSSLTCGTRVSFEGRVQSRISCIVWWWGTRRRGRSRPHSFCCDLRICLSSICLWPARHRCSGVSNCFLSYPATMANCSF